MVHWKNEENKQKVEGWKKVFQLFEIFSSGNVINENSSNCSKDGFLFIAVRQLNLSRG
jgi:hypothetical protein